MIKQIEPTQEFPLVYEFTLEHPHIVSETLQAGFRDEAHFDAYRSQLWERNKVKITNPTVVRRLL